MRQFGVFLLVAVVAVGFFFRRQIAPYAPGWAQAYMAPATDKTAQAAKPGRLAPPTAVTVATAASGTLPILRNTIGSIVPVSSTTLSSQIAGTIAEVVAKDGAEVSKGDVLIRLDQSTIKAQLAKDAAQANKDQATVVDAKATYDRAQRLVATGAGTVQSGDDALAALRVAQGTLAVDQAAQAADTVQLTQTEIKAPFDGRLGAVGLSAGAFVSPGAALVRITQMKPVLAAFNLPETDLALIRKAMAGKELDATVVPVLKDGSTAPTIKGPVMFIDNAIDASSATVQLRAALANEDEALWPGQTVNVTLQAGTTPQLVLVPGVAVAPHANGSTVFVLAANNSVELRKVTVALRVGDVAGLSDGLKAGEQVIVEGQGTLINGAKVTVSGSKGPGKSGQAESDSNPLPASGVTKS